ncbi:fibronectin type III domain-containing protein [Leucobacter albus]|uniref:Fibronectin type III domain-containing protein n=1 Tax=Leucobacter albus TaxID=272210 RepID=A0ABW3TQ22_9MICO
MTNPATAARLRRGTTALALAALVGSGLAIPLASPASATSAEAPAASAEAPAAAPAAATPVVPKNSLIETGTKWKYLDTNVDPAAGAADRNAWAAPGFDDSAWPTAPSGFGVKKNELGAVGPYTPATKLSHYIDGNAKNTVPTYFFRTTVELEAGVAAEVGKVAATIIHDDAARVFVNGQKVVGLLDARVDDSLPSNLQYAGDSKGDPVVSEFTIDPALLRDGTNTIAVALYQDRESSSDAYFDLPKLELTAKGDAGTEPGGDTDPVVAAPTRVILTPTETPAVSQSFSWLAGDASHTTGQVEIGLAAGGDTRSVEAKPVGAVNGNEKEHFSATIGELSPATSYRYRVGTAGSMSEWYSFTTETPGATDFQFVYYGDAQIGLDTTWPSVVKQAEAKATRSIGSVHAGDLINTGNNDTEWQNWFKGMEHSATSTNVMAAPGNHEYQGDKALASWKAHFEYPLNQPSTESIGELAKLSQGDTEVAKQYAAYFEHWADFAAETVYYTDYQGVRFITLNATRDTTFLKPANLPGCTGAECPSTKVQELWTEYQAAWLDFVLKNSPSKWNVVTFHQPVYSTSKGRNEPVLREHWVPVFEENNIDLVLMGHDHTYARGFNNDDRTATSGVTNGPVYTVSNSGAKHYDLESEEKNIWTNNGATQVIRGERVTTYQVIDVTENQLTYRSYVAETVPGSKSFKLADASGERPVYAAAEVPAVGEVFDEFTVTKYNTGEKWVTEAGVTAPAGPAIALDATSVKPGGKVKVSGTGFAPGSKIALELHSEPVSLGTVEVGADRAFESTVTIPANTPASTEHSLVAVLPNGSTVSTPLTVTAADTGETKPGVTKPGEQVGGKGSGSIAATGGEAFLPLGVAAATLLALGAALVVWRRRAAIELPEGGEPRR